MSTYSIPVSAPRPWVWHRVDLTAIGRRRGLQIGLGMLWLLDAALQYQPYMFTKDFASGLGATAKGDPSVIAHPITWSASFVGHHVAVYNVAFATIQLILAAGILYRPTVRVALAASIPWAVAVWWFGEGLGGSLTGGTPITGTPGAVVLYAVVAVLVWPNDRASETGESVATSGPLGRWTARGLWVLLWGSSAYFLLLAANRAPSALHDTVTGMASGQPQWIKNLDSNLGSLLDHRGTEWSFALAALCLVVAAGVVIPRLMHVAVVLAIGLALAFWAAEDFGGIFTSQGTDPNSGLILVLLALVFWPQSRHSGRQISSSA